MGKVKFMVVIVLVLVLVFIRFDEVYTHRNNGGSFSRESIYDYMNTEENRQQVFLDAMALNNNSSENACVYFVSEVLRKNNYSMPNATAHTTQLVSILEKDGWKKVYDYKKLQPGDICFTTDYYGDTKGYPTHTYVFMGWVEEGNYDFAYICDNQAKDYDDQILHIRNIKDRVVLNGITKDAFSFFMKAPKQK
jgi:hypothetical protein